MKPQIMWAVLHTTKKGEPTFPIQGCIAHTREAAIDNFMDEGTLPSDWREWRFPKGRYIARKVTVSTLPEKPRAKTRERKKGRT